MNNFKTNHVDVKSEIWLKDSVEGNCFDISKTSIKSSRSSLNVKLHNESSTQKDSGLNLTNRVSNYLNLSSKNIKLPKISSNINLSSNNILKKLIKQPALFSEWKMSGVTLKENPIIDEYYFNSDNKNKSERRSWISILKI